MNKLFVCAAAVAMFMVVGCSNKDNGVGPTEAGGNVDASLIGTWQLCNDADQTVIDNGMDMVITNDSMYTVVRPKTDKNITVLVPLTRDYTLGAESGNLYTVFSGTKIYMYDYTITAGVLYLHDEKTATYTPVTKTTSDFQYRKKS